MYCLKTCQSYTRQNLKLAGIQRDVNIFYHKTVNNKESARYHILLTIVKMQTRRKSKTINRAL